MSGRDESPIVDHSSIALLKNKTRNTSQRMQILIFHAHVQFYKKKDAKTTTCIIHNLIKSGKEISFLQHLVSSEAMCPSVVRSVLCRCQGKLTYNPRTPNLSSHRSQFRPQLGYPGPGRVHRWGSRKYR